MYIRYNTTTKQVIYFGKGKPLNKEDGTYTVAEVESLPDKFDWLTYENGELVAHFYEYTEEEIAARKEKKYNNRTTQLIRLRYDANAVEALLANYADDKEKYQEEFDVFTAYRKECKAQARTEVYGG